MKIVFLLPDRFEAFRNRGTLIETFYLETGFANQYCRSLTKLGHDVSLFYISAETKGTSGTSVTKHIFGHKLVRISSRGPPYLKSLITAFKILRTREFAESQIVHTFNYYNSLVLFVSIFAGIKNKIVVGSSHRYPATLRLSEKLMVMISLRFMTHVVCLNNEETKRVIEHLLIRPEKVSTIPNGIDVEFHHPSDRKEARLKLGLSTVAKYVLCVSVLHVEKGQHILLQAFKNVVEKFPNTHLVIVGTGPFKNDLETLGKKLKLDSLVTFAGYVSEEQKSNWYNAADLFVFPSFLEVFPLVLLEAMSHELPIVSTDVSGWTEITNEGNVGITVPKGAPNSLAEAIITLLKDDNLRKELATAGRSLVLKKFTWDIMGERLENLYLRLSS